MVRRKKSPEKVLLGLKGAFVSPSALEASLKNTVGNPLTAYCNEFRASQEHILNEMHKAILKFSQQPLFAAFLSWIEDMRSVYPEIFNHAQILINEKFLSLLDEKKNFLTVASVKYFDHIQIINTIRLQKALSLTLREDLVSTYLSFTYWLETETHDYVSRAFDPDEMKRQGRAIHYSMFIKLLEHLDDKMQLVAKLLYFGGSRTLDEVLSLDLNDVDYQQRVIKYGSQLISYPEHIFHEIKAITQGRTGSKGRVFIGRQNANLNPATIFRNFKEAASRVGLGESFSPKSLTTSV